MEFLSGNKRTWNDFESQVPQQTKPLFEDFRNYCLSLGDNVVEDVRMHRIVFGKSLTFRWFADIEPQNDAILLKIQRNRKEQPANIQVKPHDDTNHAKQLIKEAYHKIH